MGAMSDDQSRDSNDNSHAAKTIGNRRLVEKAIERLQPYLPESASAESTLLTVDPPWTLQQFFDGEIDLDQELSARHKQMPVMSTIKFRGLGTRSSRGVATLTTQDGSAQIVIDADKQTKQVQISFTLGAMLTMRFNLRDLSDADRQHWLGLMQRDGGGLAFLWGAMRWESDYVICIKRKYYTNFFAFSPNNFEAVASFTPDVTAKLLGWLDGFWKVETPQVASGDDEDEDPLLTW